MRKMNCWEHINCGRQPNGARVDQLGVCPASVDLYAGGINDGQCGGRICWAVAGTLCGGKVRGTQAHKEITCMSCEFFKAVEHEQGPDFVLLKPGQEFRRRSQ